MNYNFFCPVCQGKDQLFPFKWGVYNIIHCAICHLDYCPEMVQKEIGGDSSPVNISGIKMMSNAFHKTNELAKMFSINRKKVYEKLLNRNCDSILEVGCGPGVFYRPWTDLNVKWTGVDINPYWKKFGEENEVPISNDSIDSIKNKFDVVVAHQVIEHVEDPISFMKYIKLLLKPEGIIHLELPNQFSLSARLRKISSRVSPDYGFIQPPMHLRAYTRKTVEYLFQSLNLNTKMIIVCGNTDRIWGQVRDYNLAQRFFYTFSGRIGMGSLLIGIAKIK